MAHSCPSHLFSPQTLWPGGDSFYLSHQPLHALFLPWGSKPQGPANKQKRFPLYLMEKQNLNLPSLLPEIPKILKNKELNCLSSSISLSLHHPF
jgi:hypothetical protein